MPIPVGPIIAGLIKLGAPRGARWILEVVGPWISRMKSPSIRMLMVELVPKMLEASFGRMNDEDKATVSRMLRSVAQKFAAPGVPDDASGEIRFKQKLQEIGLLAEVASPSGPIEGDRTPVKVKGKPISQTIIEERR